MYRAGKRRASKRRKAAVLLLASLFLLASAAGAGLYFYKRLQPKTTISQSPPNVKKISYGATSKHYEEANFEIDLPAKWQKMPRPAGPYTTYSWQTSRNGSDGEIITIYENTIPVNFAVNRVLIVEPQADHVVVRGTASDNCSTFTKGLSQTPNREGAPAKWQGIDFLCDQANTQRDVIGTSSTDGVNKVKLTSQTTKQPHTYFFTYTNHSVSPDYSAFYSALSSFRLK